MHVHLFCDTGCTDTHLVYGCITKCKEKFGNSGNTITVGMVPFEDSDVARHSYYFEMVGLYYGLVQLLEVCTPKSITIFCDNNNSLLILKGNGKGDPFTVGALELANHINMMLANENIRAHYMHRSVSNNANILYCDRLSNWRKRNYAKHPEDHGNESITKYVTNFWPKEYHKHTCVTLPTCQPSFDMI